MSGIVRDYAKCVYANKFTLGGYGISLFGAGVMFGSAPDGDAWWNSDKSLFFVSGFAVFNFGFFVGILGTNLGLDTYRTYRRTRDHIDRFGHVSEDFKDKLTPVYCNRVGFELALREAGLDSKL